MAGGPTPTGSTSAVREASPDGANRPRLLDRPGEVREVTEGKVDVFAVRLQDGRPVGPREYVLSARAGELLLGMEPAAGLGLLAVGLPSSRVERRDDAPGDLDREGLERWIESLATATGHGGRASEDVALTPGDRWNGPGGRALAPAEGVAWIRVREGAVAFAGREELRLGPGTVIPLGEDGWVRTLEPAGVDALEPDAVAEGDTLEEGLRTLHGAVLGWLAAEAEERRRDERARLEDRVELDRRTRSAAFARLAGVVGDAPPVPPDAAEEPLVAAARAVGRAAGVEISAPTGEETWRTVGDRVEAVARASGARCREVVLRGGWWTADAGPLLGFRASDDEDDDEPTPVALLPSGPGSYEMWDPAAGRERVPVDATVAEGLDPFAWIFYRPLPSRSLSARDLWRYLGFGLRRDVLTLVLTGLGGAILGLAPPVATGLVFDWIIPSADRVQLVHVFVGLVVIAVSVALFGITRNFAFLRIRTKVTPALQLAVVDRLIRLPLPFFRRFEAGDLAQRTSAVNAVGSMLGSATISTIMGSLVSFGTVVLLFWYSPRLAVAALGVVLVVALFTLATSLVALKHQRRLEAAEGRVQGLVLQLLGAISKIRVAAAETRAFSRWSEDFAEARRRRFEVGLLQSNVVAFNDAMTVVASLVIFGVYAWIASDAAAVVTTGRFIAFTAAFGTFLGAALELTRTAVSLLEVIPTLERAGPILEAQPESDEERPAPGRLSGRIEVSKVSFRYDEDSPPVLRDVSLVAEEGRLVAIVGPSGAGKSTLLRVLLGFEEPTSGSVYYDGQDLASVDPAAVRRQIGVVLQSSRLTAGSILSNIVGSATYTESDAWRAARMAGLEEDLEAMPMGMHTVVSEAGSNLSGGQRQRLLIARALVRRPRIVFFDEATSALDNRTQQVVSESLERLNATRIVIAHRLSTIRRADRIYVLRAGEVVQEGTYEELMGAPGLFADLASRQTV